LTVFAFGFQIFSGGVSPSRVKRYRAGPRTLQIKGIGRKPGVGLGVGGALGVGGGLGVGGVWTGGTKAGVGGNVGFCGRPKHSG